MTPVYVLGTILYCVYWVVCNMTGYVCIKCHLGGIIAVSMQRHGPQQKLDKPSED